MTIRLGQLIAVPATHTARTTRRWRGTLPRARDGGLSPQGRFALRSALCCVTLAFVVLLNDVSDGAFAPPSNADAPPGNAPSSPGRSASPPRKAEPPPLEMEPRLEILRPASPRSPDEEDRLAAEARFAQARAAENRGRPAEALRLYQRAHRLDPQSAAVQRAIVSLAYRLDRPAVAARYALRMPNLSGLDALLLRRLGVFLSEQAEWLAAIRMYEAAIAARAGEKTGPADVLLWMELGRICHLGGEYVKAAEHFHRVLAALAKADEYGIDDRIRGILLSEPAATYGAIGECFLRAGRVDEAAQAFAQADDFGAHPGLHALRQARIAAARQQWQAALAELDHARESGIPSEDPTNEEEAEAAATAIAALTKLDRQAEVAAHLRRDFERAQAAAEAAAPPPQSSSAKVEFHGGGFALALAQWYAKADQQPQAIAFYNAAARRGAAREALLAWLRLLVAARDATGLFDAFAIAADRLELPEDLAALQLGAAENQSLVEALVHVAQQRAQAPPNPADYGGYLCVGLTVQSLRRDRIAAELLRHAIQADEEQAAAAALLWSEMLMDQQQHAAASGLLRELIDGHQQPKATPLLRYYLADALSREGKYDAALAAAKQAAQERPRSARFLTESGRILALAQRNDEAIAAYDRVIARFEGDYRSPESREAVRASRLALAALHHDDAAAEESLELVLDEFPDDPDALNDLAYAWSDRSQNLHRAIVMIEKAVAAQPDNAAFRDTLGWVYFRLGRLEAAIAELERAAAASPEGTVLEHLGDALRAVGRIEDARDRWTAAAKRFAETGEADRAAAVREKLSAAGPGTR